MAITAAREARRLIPSKVVTRLLILALFNFEGIPSICTLKTEQRKEEKSKATERRDLRRSQTTLIVELF